MGLVVGLDAWRVWLIGASALLAFAIALRRRPIATGLRRQVPRAWNQTMAPGRRYFLWGAMLGSGVMTPILASAFWLLVGAQMTTGPVVGAASGAVFGAARQSVAVVPGLVDLDPGATMALLQRYRSATRRLNAAVALAGGFVLVMLAWH